MWSVISAILPVLLPTRPTLYQNHPVAVIEVVADRVALVLVPVQDAPVPVQAVVDNCFSVLIKRQSVKNISDETRQSSQIYG